MQVPEEVVRMSEQRAPARTAVAPAVRKAVGVVETTIEAERMLSAPRAAAPAAVRRSREAAPPPPTQPRRQVSPARVQNLRFAGALPTDTEFERMIGTNDLVDEFYLERALLAAQPVCRLVVQDPASGRRGYATGFLISPTVLLTNWHVFPEALNARAAIAQFNYKLNIRGEEVPYVEFDVDPDRMFFSDGRLDFALVAVRPVSRDGGRKLADFGYHRLIAEENKIAEGEWVTIIQHPGGARRQFSIRENQLLEKQDPFLWYASDTAQGSSGAPAFNDQFQVVALHHSGKARRDTAGNYLLKDGTSVPSLKNVDDAEVDWEKNEGLRVSRLCQRIAAAISARQISDELAAELNAAMAGGDIMSKVISQVSGAENSVPNSDGNGSLRMGIPSGAAGGMSTVQLNIATVNIQNITIGPPAPATPPSPVTPPPHLDKVETEKLVEPITDPNYGNRKGYNEKYLGVTVPMPEATDKTVVSKMDNGRHEIPYQHFSIVIHKERRLALFTASNVDGSKKSRQPTNTAFNRKELTGLGENDQEKWITDPRIPEQHQLPDKFYNQDRKAFDKGHIVRRDDVCWGKTFEIIQRANGDTFHTTNCSPQVKEFNQSKFQGLWGLLENEILKQAAAETYCLFAGPVLDPEDPVFQGRDLRGKVEIHIPQRYWKIISAVKDGTLQSFAFVLEQDLGKVKFTEEEFIVPDEWQTHLYRISDLEQLLGNVRFPKVVKDADQYDEAGGHELLLLDGVKRHE